MFHHVILEYHVQHEMTREEFREELMEDPVELIFDFLGVIGATGVTNCSLFKQPVFFRIIFLGFLH